MCEYQATQHSHLKMHERSAHEGIMYPCSMCDYQATLQSHLKRHERSAHEGVKYPCQAVA